MKSILIDRNSTLSLGKQIKNGIKGLIRTGGIPAGEKVPSVREIVEQTGVSYAIAAKAVSELVNEKILEKKRGVGVFAPSSNISTPAELKSHNFIFLFSNRYQNPQDQYHGQIFDGMQNICAKSALCLSFMAYPGPKEFEDAIKRFNGIGGLILSSTLNDKEIYEISQFGYPMVLYGIEAQPEIIGIDVVCPDNFEGGRIATKHLIELGHRRIAFIGNRKDIRFAKREAGYRQALLENGIMPDEKLIGCCNEDNEKTEFLVRNILEPSRDKVTAIFAGNDSIAEFILNGFMIPNKIKVPEEVSLIGFDNRNIASELSPPLTTIDFSKKDLGAVALERLLQKVKNPSLFPITLSIPVKLLKRASSAAPLLSQ